jgi:hypothetical protein
MTGRNRMAEGDAPGNRTARRLLGQVLVDGDFISAGNSAGPRGAERDQRAAKCWFAWGGGPREITGVIAISWKSAGGGAKPRRLGQIPPARPLDGRQLDVAAFRPR